MRYKIYLLVVLVLAVLLGLNANAATPIIRLATTTSTDNTGLLKVLIPPFEKQTGYRVHVIAVGTGKALRMAKDGDVDVVLVHAYDDEMRFVEHGFGVNRRDVMYNDFVVVGPRDDPADIDGLHNAAAALRAIAAKQAVFVSRGDDSGTHKKEKALWRIAKMTPAGTWYREIGQGMGKTLQMAFELKAYTLTDRGTWIAYREKIPGMRVLVEGDSNLYNRYGIIAVNPARFADVNYAGAMQLIGWTTSRQGQTIIRDFRIKNEALFTPLAITDADKPISHARLD